MPAIIEKPDTDTVTISYFSDVLCIWAYIAQIKLDQIKKQFGSQVIIQHHFLSVFGNTNEKIGNGWHDRNGYLGYSEHTKNIASQFDHINLHSKTWHTVRPPSSTGCHLFLKAVQLFQDNAANESEKIPANNNLVEKAAWLCRLAFFRDALNIAEIDVQLKIASQLELPIADIRHLIDNGTAYAALHSDQELKSKYLLEGSPTFTLNHGRQKLYGNVGYKIIEANIHEILQQPQHRASWC